MPLVLFRQLPCSNQQRCWEFVDVLGAAPALVAWVADSCAVADGDDDHPLGHIVPCSTPPSGEYEGTVWGQRCGWSWRGSWSALLREHYDPRYVLDTRGCILFVGSRGIPDADFWWGRFWPKSVAVWAGRICSPVPRRCLSKPHYSEK